MNAQNTNYYDVILFWILSDSNTCQGHNFMVQHLSLSGRVSVRFDFAGYVKEQSWF